MTLTKPAKRRITEYDSRSGHVILSNIEFGEAYAATGYEDKLVRIQGKLSLNLIDSEKFEYGPRGPQVHLQVYAPMARVVARRSEKWSRVEIFFSWTQLRALTDALLRCQLQLERPP